MTDTGNLIKNNDTFNCILSNTTYVWKKLISGILYRVTPDLIVLRGKANTIHGCLVKRFVHTINLKIYNNTSICVLYHTQYRFEKITFELNLVLEFNKYSTI